MYIVKKYVKEISKFCCTKMETAFDSKIILFPNLDLESIHKPRICGPRDIRIAALPAVLEIDFCPFCGEKIAFEEKS